MSWIQQIDEERKPKKVRGLFGDEDFNAFRAGADRRIIEAEDLPDTAKQLIRKKMEQLVDPAQQNRKFVLKSQFRTGHAGADAILAAAFDEAATISDHVEIDTTKRGLTGHPFIDLFYRPSPNGVSR